ncbi:hypothetical protein DPMN_018377 [Dreissena polymorpha]|uniref:Uncharacterized protein n=1 Tax=Dreissena polymorpha TaxID=45954 RepID=A0A9D4NH56_DREPO|nr:hypothetical protein DPMN_018377 [Dreissena polymorpha]
MMKRLDWDTLEARRQHSKAIMMFRIVNNLVDIQSQHIYYQLVFIQEATRTGSLYPWPASMPTNTHSFPPASASGTAYQKRRSWHHPTTSLRPGWTC